MVRNVTTWTSVATLAGKHTRVMIRRHVAIRIYEPKVVTNFLSPQTSCMSALFE